VVRVTLKTILYIISLVILVSVWIPLPVQGKVVRKHPCDPKFGYTGNYLEITTGDTADKGDINVCFGDVPDPELLPSEAWWQVLWERIWNPSAGKVERKVQTCISLASLPGRLLEGNSEWSGWQKGLPVNRKDTTFQFALCGSNTDPSVWENFQRYLGVDSWDGMRIVAGNDTRVMVEKLRVVQNRVRILDNERADEGDVHVLLSSAGPDGQRELDLADRIRKTKLNRINCLNIKKGPPYCEEKIPGLNRDNLSPVIRAALLELGHSGSKKYRRENNAYCSEFSFYVIEKGAHLSRICTKMVPDPDHDDVSVRDMFRWFKLCGRIVPRNAIREKIRPGDYLSVDNMLHSVTFLGWADPEKKYFWEISGNNRCLPERETFYAPKNKANMVCISKRDFDRDIRDKDFGATVGE